MEESFMAKAEVSVNPWSMTNEQLAHECKTIAHQETISEAIRHEAGRLVEEWKDALHIPDKGFEDPSRKAAQTAALKKRTIEIMVRVNNQQEAAHG
jgi:hypothetical protein